MKPFHLASVALLMLTTAASHAIEPTVLQLQPKWESYPAGFGLGSAHGTVACNDTWIVVGAPSASAPSFASGTVQVFSATTGAWVRNLHNPAPSSGFGFGAACAVNGNIAVIGATDTFAAAPGAVFCFDLTTGKLLRTLDPPSADDVVGNFFGYSIATDGNRVLVGAPRLDKAYVFDLSSGALLSSIHAPTPSPFAAFGQAVALEGRVAAIGHPRVDSDRGAVYLFDLDQTGLGAFAKLQPAASQSGDLVGLRLAMHGGRIVVGTGAPVGRSAYLVRLSDYHTQVIEPSGLTSGDLYGSSLAVQGNLILMGAPGKGVTHLFHLAQAGIGYVRTLSASSPTSRFGSAVSLGLNAAVVAESGGGPLGVGEGSVYLFRPVVADQWIPLATRGNLAPPTGSRYDLLGDAVLGPFGLGIWGSSLSGIGAQGKSGLFYEDGSNLKYVIATTTQSDNAGLTLQAMSKPLLNTSFCIFQSTLSGPNVTTANNSGIYSTNTFNAASINRVFRRGSPLSNTVGQPLLSTYAQVILSSGVDRIGLAFNYQLGINGVTASNDSGIATHPLGVIGFQTDIVREGTAAPGTTESHGQIAPRIAAYWDRATYSAALTGPTVSNAAVFQRQAFMTTVLVARKGVTAPYAGASPYSAFIGESSDSNDTVLYRATLGPPATTANNEGLWTRTTAGVVNLVMRKGDAVPGLTNVMIGKFINYWQSAGQTLALVQFTGAGVTANNDLALIEYQTTGPVSGTLNVLMREGDPAPGCAPATIGVISQVDVESRFATYQVLVTLKGASSGRDQALFRGLAARPLTNNAEQVLRRPVVIRRKGQFYIDHASKLTSMAFSTSGLTASGAGNVGLGSPQSPAFSETQPSYFAIKGTFESGETSLLWARDY